MLLPAVTGSGAPELVTARSAWPALATSVLATAELLPELGSGVDAEMFAVSVIVVPEAVPELTLRTMANVELANEAKEGSLQEMVPVKPAGIGLELQVQPAGAGNATPSVVFVGMVSVKTALEAAEGPLFVTTAVMVTLLPAMTVGAEAVLVTARSA